VNYPTDTTNSQPFVLTATGIEELALRLDGLPLSLNYAGCYMAQKQMSARRYLQKYDEEFAGRKKLLEHIPRLSSYNMSMMTTWEISLQAVQAESQRAAELLTVCSFLHNSIFCGLFRFSYESTTDWLRQIALDEDLFQDQIELLSDFSFLRLNEGHNFDSYTIHPVVQDWGRDRLDREVWMKGLYDTIFVTAAAVSTEKSLLDWTLRRLLVSHADRCKEFLEKSVPNQTKVFDSLDRLGFLYYDMGRMEDAEGMFTRALKLYKLRVGPDDKVTLLTMNALAMVYKAQGKLEKAEEMLQRTITGMENEHLDASTIVGVRTNLANVYIDQGNFSTARSIFKQALKYLEGAEETDEVQLYNSLLSLSTTFRAEVNLDEAETGLQTALEGFQRVLGSENIQTLVCIGNLGNVYCDQGRWSDAETAFQQTIAGHEKILGPTHLSTLDVLINLCRVYVQQEKFEEAEALSQRVLEGNEEARGPKHPKTLLSVVVLGQVHRAQKRYQEAKTHFRRALQGFEEERGPDHESTIGALYDLASVYADEKRFAEAEVLFQQLLTKRERISGPEHAKTLLALMNLAFLCEDQKRPEEAEAMYGRAIEGYDRTLGLMHPSTLLAVQRSGSFYISQGNLKEARLRLDRALKGFQEVLGPNDPRTLRTTNLLSEVEEIEEEVIKSNTLGGPTMPVEYLVMCGNPSPGGYSCRYSFAEQAPASLCDKPDLTGLNPDPSAISRFLQLLIFHHHDEILQLRSWRCQICGKPAQELFHKVVPLLSPGIRASPDFKPVVWDTAVPVCRLAGDCDRSAERMAGKFMMQCFPTLEAKPKNCDYCGMIRDVKRCRGCKVPR
jgi:tetratricopeptide (TPR) repeat protein